MPYKVLQHFIGRISCRKLLLQKLAVYMLLDGMENCVEGETSEQTAVMTGTSFG